MSIYKGMMQPEIIEAIAKAFELLDKNNINKLHGMVECEMLNREFNKGDIHEQVTD